MYGVVTFGASERKIFPRYRTNPAYMIESLQQANRRLSNKILKSSSLDSQLTEKGKDIKMMDEECTAKPLKSLFS